MSQEQSKEGSQEKKKGGKIALAAGGIVVVAAVAAVGFALGTRSGGEEDSGNTPQATPVPWAEKSGGSGTIMDESMSGFESQEELTLGGFEVYMTTDWSFDSSTLTCPDAYVANLTNNVYNMYFELVETSTNVTVYTSPLIEIGDYVEGLTLDTPLDPGIYEFKMVHHLLDPSTNQEIDGLDLALDIEIF